MKRLFYLFFCCLYLQSYVVLAQITGPDTVCVGSSVSLTSSPVSITHKWDFSPVSVIQPISPLSALCTPTGVPAWSCFNKDGGNYYLFITDYNTGHIKRFSFGSSIYSTPVMTDFGTFGATAGNLEGIDVVRDSATGNWYGVAINYSQLIVLSFGSSLSGAPTATVTTHPQISWAHQVSIKRYAGGWVAFAANRNGTVIRFDFGTSLTSMPLVTTLPTAGVAHSPCNFSLYQQSGNWYMIFSNLLNGSVGRYSFGTNLQNNAPAATLIVPASTFSLPRPINLLVDCQNNLIGYLITEAGQITRLNFAGSITNTPTLTSLGSLGISQVNSTAPCAYSDSFTIATLSYGGTVKKFHPLNYSTPPPVNYYSTAQSYTFTTAGLHSITLFNDMGYASGPSVFCKQIYAKPCSTSAHPPHFINGPRDSVLLCGNEVYYPVDLDTILAVIDSDAGDALTWSIITPPMHGIAVVSYATTATGGIVYPSGLTYTPTLGYMGVDSFKVRISDGTSSDSITVKMTMNPMSPDPGTISGADSVCPGATITMSETVSGGTWSSTDPSVATINSTGVVTGIAPGGIDTIKYFVDNGCGISNAYKVIYVRKNCTAGIFTGSDYGRLSVHPNPSNGQFIVTVPATENERVQILVRDVFGRQIKSWIAPGNTPFKVELDSPPGFYIIEALTEHARWLEKVRID